MQRRWVGITRILDNMKVLLRRAVSCGMPTRIPSTENPITSRCRTQPPTSLKPSRRSRYCIACAGLVKQIAAHTLVMNRTCSRLMGKLMNTEMFVSLFILDV